MRGCIAFAMLFRAPIRPDRVEFRGLWLCTDCICFFTCSILSRFTLIRFDLPLASVSRLSEGAERDLVTPKAFEWCSKLLSLADIWSTLPRFT
jgi:hypothetical protein